LDVHCRVCRFDWVRLLKHTSQCQVRRRSCRRFESEGNFVVAQLLPLPALFKVKAVMSSRFLSTVLKALNVKVN
jgi:hypothetical protein